MDYEALIKEVKAIVAGGLNVDKQLHDILSNCYAQGLADGKEIASWKGSK